MGKEAKLAGPAATKPARDPLIHPYFFKLASAAKAGKLTKESMAKPVPSHRACIPPEFLPFVTSPTIVVLADLLKECPRLWWHPLVRKQVYHLRYGIGADQPDDEQLRRAAFLALRDIVEAWLQGFMGAGWRLRPPKGRPGRKTDAETIGWDFWLLGLYEELGDRLPKNVRRVAGESDHEWRKRLTDIIRRVWEESEMSKDYPAPDQPSAASAALGPNDVEALLAMRLPEPVTLPLPDAELSRWVADAVEMAAEGPIRDRLAYEMIGFLHKLRVGQVRGRIQAARRFDKPKP